MAVSFVAAGALAVESAGDQTLPVVAPTCQEDDILICCAINKALTVAMSAPDATWTQLYQADADCTTAADDHRAAIFWRRATNADSGATFNFTKASGTVLYAAVISAWRGCNPFVPIDLTAVGATVTAGAADTVSFPDFNPTHQEAHILYVAFYGNDLTTFATALSVDVNPDCTLRFDLETSTGNDASIAVASGLSDGSAAGARTWASVSTTDAGSTGVVFALVPKMNLPNNYRFAGAFSSNTGIISVGDRIR